MINIKRVYEAVAAGDGKRFLVERLWPRGVKKDALHMESWLKEVAPSAALRTWFSHDPAKWAEFQRRYRAELTRNPDSWQPLIEAAQKGDLTLLFSSHDLEHNNAVVLQAFLEKQLKKCRSRAGA